LATIVGGGLLIRGRGDSKWQNVDCESLGTSMGQLFDDCIGRPPQLIMNCSSSRHKRATWHLLALLVGKEAAWGECRNAGMLGWNAGMQQCCDAAMQWGSIGVNDGQWVFLGGGNHWE